MLEFQLQKNHNTKDRLGQPPLIFFNDHTLQAFSFLLLGDTCSSLLVAFVTGHLQYTIHHFLFYHLCSYLIVDIVFLLTLVFASIFCLLFACMVSSFLLLNPVGQSTPFLSSSFASLSSCTCLTVAILEIRDQYSYE